MKYKHARFFYWMMIILCVFLVAVSIFIWRYALYQENQHTDRIVRNEQKNLTVAIKEMVERDGTLLKAIGGQWKGAKKISQEKWQKSLLGYIAKRSEISAITWVDSSGVSRWVVPYYQKSIKMNDSFGYEPRRKEVLKQAKQSNQLSISRVVNLLDGDKGIFVVYPIYLSGKFDGYIVGVFNVQALFDSIIKAAKNNGFGVLLRDQNELVYASDIENLYRNKRWSMTSALTVFGKRWHLDIWPLQSLVETIRSPLPLVLLISGILFSFFITALMWLIRKQQRNSEIIQLRNADLAELQDKNQILLNTAGEGICGLDVDGRITFFNRAAEKILGFSSKEVIGQSMHDLVRHSDKQGNKLSREMCKILDSIQDSIVYQANSEVFWSKTGRAIPVEYISTPIIKGQHAMGAVVTFNDISLRLEAENKLKSRKNEVELIYELTELLNEASTFDYALRQAVVLICEKMHWDVGHVYLPISKESKALKSTNIWHVSQQIDIDEFKKASEEIICNYGVGLPGTVLKTQRPHWVADIANDATSPRAKLCSALSIHAGVAFPIVLSGDVIAVLEFFSQQAISNDENMIDVFFVLSAQLSRVWQKREIEKAIQEREAKYSALIKSAVEIIIVSNAEGIALECNDVIAKVLGYLPSEVVGSNVSMLMPEPEKSKHDKYIQRYLKTGDARVVGRSIEVNGQHKDGRLVPLHLTLSEIEVKGQREFVAVMRDISDQVAVKQQLEALAHHDYLTGLENRFCFDKEVEKMLARESRQNARLALIYIDLDGFKKVNDTYGHHVGDALLIEFAKRVKDSVRVYDVFARLGGDEFALVLQDVDKQSSVVSVLEKILSVIATPCHIEGAIIEIIASLGVAFYPEDAKTKDQLLICADKALYCAKSKPGSSYVFYDAIKNKEN